VDQVYTLHSSSLLREASPYRAIWWRMTLVDTLLHERQSRIG